MKHNKKHKKKHHKEEQNEDSSAQPKKRIKIDLTQNQTRGKILIPDLSFILEFFSHGKVATMSLPVSKEMKSPSKAVIKVKTVSDEDK